MGGSAFDRLTRALITGGSRRHALGGMIAGTLGLLGSRDRNAAAKKKKKKPCPPCKKRKKGKCKANLPDGSACAGGTCQGGSCAPLPVTSCTDGIRNGSESDVDCGGSCARCVNGKVCNTRNDCDGAFCANNVCQECSTKEQCGTDANGQCFCEPTIGGPKTCNTSGNEISAATCGDCPPGTHCIVPGPSAVCVKPCGA